MSSPRKTRPPEAFDVHFTDRAFAIEWCIGFLRENDYACHLVPDERPWITPKELRERLAPEMPAATFHQRLSHAAAPSFLARYTEHRLSKLKSTPALEQWLTRPVRKPAKALEVIA